MVLEIREKVGKKYSVTCDGERYCRCYPKDLLVFGFTEYSEGQTVNLSMEIIRQSEQEVFLTRAKRRTLLLLGKKEYTRRELEKKLLADGYPDRVTESVLNWLSELRYVDDASFAERYAFSLLSRHSEREILQKMQQKGFKKELVKEALLAAKERYREEYTEVAGVGQVSGETVSPETEAIRTFLRKKGYRPEEENPEKRRKLVAALYRKGFLFSDIREVMGELGEEYTE